MADELFLGRRGRHIRDEADEDTWAKMSGEFTGGDLTGIVLAGGVSQRMGRDKAFLELGGSPLIAHVIERMARVCVEVLVVAGDVRPYAGLGVRLVEDRFRGVGVLGGLHAGLEAAAHELALVVGCDMPFLEPGLLQVFAGWAAGVDVVVLRQGEQVEPLHGAYRCACLPAIEAAIRANRRRIISFFPHVRVRYVAPEEVMPFDPGLRSFRNVNTPEELEAARAEWEIGVGGSVTSRARRRRDWRLRPGRYMG